MTMSYYQPGGRRGGAARASGVSAGGNALNHGPDAVPGYTGYVPGGMCVPPAVHTRLSERDPAAAVQHPAQRAAAEEAAAAAAAGTTTYAAAFQPAATFDYSLPSRAHRPTAPAAKAAVGSIAPEQECFGRSTYQMELLQRSSADINGGGTSTAPAPLHAHARSPAAGSLLRTAPLSPPAVQPGYLTTATASQLPIAEKFAAAVSLSAGCNPKSPGGSSGCRTGSAPASPAAPLAACSFPCQSPSAARVDAHCRGSGSALPGAVPACQQQQQQQQQQRVPKDVALMHALDQHSRGRLPGYTGHRPQHSVRLEPPPPSKETTWGAASQQALSRPPPPPDSGNAIDSRRGLLSFFSPGTGGAAGFVSENGLAEAARYYESVRPLEGRMKIPQPSRVNPRGAKFTG